MSDFITCKYCGVVKRGHQCPYRVDRRKKESTEARRFRGSKRWQKKSIEIRERDRYLCVVCMENKYNTNTILNHKNIGVHHIVPLAEDFDQRLDNDNLISLCEFHHHMAEAGEIPRDELLEMVKGRENESN